MVVFEARRFRTKLHCLHQDDRCVEDVDAEIKCQEAIGK